MKKIILSVFVLCTTISFSQNYCGAQLSEEQKNWLKDFQQNTIFGNSRSEEILYIPIQIHIVGNDDGNGYINLHIVLEDICDLNEQYAVSNIYFYMEGDVNYINSSIYYEHDFFNGYYLMANNNVDGRVNIYMVGDPAGNCGYYLYAGDAVAIANSCGGIGNSTIAHELGHYFSLPHNFVGWENGETPSVSNQEKVDGSNCNTAADGFCDTPADYASWRWNCSSPPNFVDPDGAEFNPDGSYFMSYSDDGCQSQHSGEQIEAIRAYIQSTRDYLLDHPAIEIFDLNDIALIEPLDAATETYPNYTVLKWNKIEHATGYNVQIGYNSTFTGIKSDVMVTDTFFIADDLTHEKKYYWRIKPIGEANTCEPASSYFTFTTGSEYSAIENIAHSDIAFSIAPNPVVNNMFTLSLEETTTEMLEFKIFSLNGVVLQQGEILNSKGVNQVNIELNNFTTGIYLVEIKNSIISGTQKIMVID